MTFTLSFGWWIAPAAVTLVSFLLTSLFAPRMQSSNGSMFPDVGGAFMQLASYLAATVVSLVAWLVWALLA